MEETLMTPDVCMMFLVWSFYYHDIIPEPNVSYSKHNKFSAEDVTRLDELKATLFRSVEEESVLNACNQFRLAKIRQEPCPFSQVQLDNMFAKEL